MTCLWPQLYSWLRFKYKHFDWNRSTKEAIQYCWTWSAFVTQCWLSSILFARLLIRMIHTLFAGNYSIIFSKLVASFQKKDQYELFKKYLFSSFNFWVISFYWKLVCQYMLPLLFVTFRDFPGNSILSVCSSCGLSSDFRQLFCWPIFDLSTTRYTHHRLICRQLRL